jgi:hypothetical protein
VVAYNMNGEARERDERAHFENPPDRPSVFKPT